MLRGFKTALQNQTLSLPARAPSMAVHAPAKKRHVDAAASAARIGTHSGSFHCDEALGCWLLKLLPEYSDAAIVRSRDPPTLDTCDVVLDVGGIYDPEKRRFDHHQRGFMEVFPGFQTKLSSAGLVYKHYGREIIKALWDKVEAPSGASEKSAAATEGNIDIVYKAAYRYFVEAIDAIDNGINQWEGNQTPKYYSDTNLSSRVSRLNPKWNSTQTGDAFIDQQFAKAMELAGSEFAEKVFWLVDEWLPARAIIEAALKNASELDSSGEIMQLEQGCPWKEHLYQLEAEMQVPEPIKYVLYEDSSGKYRVQAVGLQGSFESRKALPAEWRGLRDEQLSEVSGISGCVFVHASGFIGGNATFDGCLEMARKALRM